MGNSIVIISILEKITPVINDLRSPERTYNRIFSFADPETIKLHHFQRDVKICTTIDVLLPILFADQSETSANNSFLLRGGMVFLM